MHLDRLIGIMSLLVCVVNCLECPPGPHPCECSVVGSVVQGLAVDCDRRGMREVPDMSAFKERPINFLNLANNRITTWADDFLSGLFFQAVKPNQDPMIDLGGNAIIGTPKHAFRGIRADTLGLRLNNCSLDMIPRESLRKLENLTFLMLHGNRIQSLPSGVFTGLKKLRHLDLSSNQIRRVSSDVFTDLELSLKVLYMNRLGLTEFPAAAIEKLSKLEVLEIDKNKIKRLGDNAFRNFESKGPLTVSLSNNGLETVSQRALDIPHLELKALDLSKNKLRSLHFLNDACHPIFDRRPVVDVHDNPVICDCLLYGVVATGRIAFKGACSDPLKYRGMGLRRSFLSAARSDCEHKVAGTYANCESTTSRAQTVSASPTTGASCYVILAFTTCLSIALVALQERTLL